MEDVNVALKRLTVTSIRNITSMMFFSIFSPIEDCFHLSKDFNWDGKNIQILPDRTKDWRLLQKW